MLSLTKIQKACEQASNPDIGIKRDLHTQNAPPSHKSPKPS